MQVRKKKASGSKTGAKKASARKPGARKASSAKPRAKSAAAKATPRRSPAKEVRTTKLLKARTKAGTKATKKDVTKAKKPTVRAKSTAKTGVDRVNRAARKPPIAREVTSMREADPADVSEATTQIPTHFEMSLDPVRGGLHDGANHSKPEVQHQRQHIQTTRSPERRHTMRGH